MQEHVTGVAQMFSDWRLWTRFNSAEYPLHDMQRSRPPDLDTSWPTVDIIDHSGQSARIETISCTMPFDTDGYYAHDFRRLPIIWEQEENDEDWHSCKSPTSSDFQSGASFTTASEQPSSPTSIAKWGTPSPYLRTYRSWKASEEVQRRASVREDRRPMNRQSFLAEMNGRTPQIVKPRRKWNIFKRWSKPRFPIDDSDQESTDSDGG